MNENSDRHVDNFLEGIDDELREERDEGEGLSKRPGPPSESDSAKKLLVLAGVVVFVLILFVVYLSAGRRGPSQKEMQSMEARLTRLDSRLRAMEPLADRIAFLEKQLKGVPTSVDELKGSRTDLDKRLDALTQEVKKLQKAAVSAPPKSKARYHVVRRGDTLYGIAKKYGVTIERLQRLNRISKGQGLRIGQKIFLPPTSG